MHGEKEPFVTDSLKAEATVHHQPRYFILGGFTAAKHLKFDRIKTQCLIMKHVTGEAIVGLDEVSRGRRQANWSHWYQKSDKAKEFERKDLPVLAIQFRDFWDVTIPEDVEGRIPPCVLNGVGREIRRILRCCNRISNRTRQGTTIVDQQRVVVVSPTNKRKRAQDDDTTEDSYY
jgi:hypothetical protein